MQDDPELTAIVRSRQLHIYRNGIKVLVLAGKSAPKIIKEDPISELLQTTNEASAESSSLELCLARRSCDEIEIERIKWMEQRFNNGLPLWSCWWMESSNSRHWLTISGRMQL